MTTTIPPLATIRYVAGRFGLREKTVRVERMLPEMRRLLQARMLATAYVAGVAVLKVARQDGVLTLMRPADFSPTPEGVTS